MTKIKAMDKYHIRELIFEQNVPAKDIDVSGVTNMVGMFGGCESFNQDISNWDVSNVIYMCWVFDNTPLEKEKIK